LEERTSKLTEYEQKEMKIAQSDVMTQKYYNYSVGLNDEISKFKDDESKFDTHANPEGSDFDLGRDGGFSDYSVLIGRFDAQCGVNDASAALKKKGFKVTIVTTIKEFISGLSKCQVAWIISSHIMEENLKDSFIKAVVSYHKKGGGLLVWGDNAPLFVHANVVLPHLLGKNVQLVGDTPGGHPMTVGDPLKSGQFGPHIITTGVIKLYEGNTICYPSILGPLKVLGTSSNNHPAVCYADNECLKSETCGRIIVDCGWTKNYCSWQEAGTARYVSNATIWLLNLEHTIETSLTEGQDTKLTKENEDEVPSPDKMEETKPTEQEETKKTESEKNVPKRKKSFTSRLFSWKKD